MLRKNSKIQKEYFICSSNSFNKDEKDAKNSNCLILTKTKPKFFKLLKFSENSNKEAGKALAEELSFTSFARKGAPAKQKQNSKAQDTESGASGADTRVKEQLSHSNRQLQAMANQVRALGAVPLFVKRTNQGSNEKVTNLVHVAAAKQKAAIEALNMRKLKQVSLMQTNLKASQKQQLLLHHRRISLM